MNWEDRGKISSWAKEHHPTWWEQTKQQINDPEALDIFLLRLAEHMATEEPELARTLSFDVWKYLRRKGLLDVEQRSSKKALPIQGDAV